MNYEVTIEQVLQLSNAIIIDIRSKYKVFIRTHSRSKNTY